MSAKVYTSKEERRKKKEERQNYSSHPHPKYTSIEQIKTGLNFRYVLTQLRLEPSILLELLKLTTFFIITPERSDSFLCTR